MADTFSTFRDHFLSIYQSAAAAYASQLGEQSVRAGEVARGPASGSVGIGSGDFMSAVDEASKARFANLVASGRSDALERGLLDSIGNAKDAARVCANLGMRYLEAKARGDARSAERIRGQLDASTCDPNWARTLDEYVSYFGIRGDRREIPYISPDASATRVIQIEPTSKIVILGDWGTGAKPAVELLRHVKAQEPDILVHLGDIYYSGTSRECDVNFRQVLDRGLDRTNTSVRIFSLAGNHDMYSGGAAYYAMIKSLNSPPFDQQTSFFCLRTTDGAWQFLAMDTALHDYSPFSVGTAVTFLDPKEEGWHMDRLREFAGKTVLLSHHQLFSGFSQIGPADALGNSAFNENLLGSYRKFQGMGASIAAWFWGHEHNMCIYQPYGGLMRGRCLGHGAIPTFTTPDPYSFLTNLNNPPQLIANTKLKNNESVFANGFATLTLAPGSARVDYFQVLDGDCSIIYSELIS